MTDKPKRAAIYVRVSTDEQAEEDKSSLPEQEAKCRQYAVLRDWEVVHVHREGGESGAKASRPELDDMMGDLSRYDVIIISKLDRLGRNTRHLLEVAETLKECGVELASVNDGFDTTTPSGLLFFTLLAAFGEFERSQIMERTTSGITATWNGGWWGGGPAPYGFMLADDGGHKKLVKEPDEYPIFRRAVDLLVAGWSEQDVIDLFNEDEPARKGKGWTQGTIRNWFIRSRNGVREVKRVYLGGPRHEPLMTEAELDAVLLRFPAHTGATYGRKAPKFLGHRLIICECGERLSPRSKDNTYECYGRWKKKNGCTVPKLPKSLVDPGLFTMIERRVLNAKARDESAAAAFTQMRTAKYRAVKRAEAEVKKLDEALLRTHDEYDLREISGKTYEASLKRQTRKRVLAAQRQQDAQSALDELKEPAAERTYRSLADIVIGPQNDVQSVERINRALRPFVLFQLQRCETGLEVGELDSGAQFQQDGFTFALVPRAVHEGDDNLAVEWAYDSAEDAWQAVDYDHDVPPVTVEVPAMVSAEGSAGAENNHFGPSGMNSASRPSARNQSTIASCGGFSVP